MEGRIGQLDEFLSFTCDLRRFIRIVGNARISKTLLESTSRSEVGVTSGLEHGNLSWCECGTRVWSRLLRNRVERNWNWWWK